MIIKRDKYIKKLISYRHNGMIKVITGIRRCGKSYLLFRLFRRYLEDCGIDDSHIIEVAFDDFLYSQYREPTAFYNHVKQQIKDKNMYYLLLDEVQMLNSFADVLNGLLRLENVDIYVTGSNARFLSKDVITEFRGRGCQIHVTPLSFAEFMSVYDGNKYDGWNEYLLYGGLPAIVLQNDESNKMEMLKNLLEETYITDIIGRNRVKNDGELADLLKILASGIGCLTNPQKLSDTFISEKKIRISSTTIKNYIDFFADAFLIEQANRYDVKGRKYIGTPLKYYFSDLGLRNVCLNFRQPEKTHLMENAIYNELRRRGYSVDVGNVIVNGKNETGVSTRTVLEIDFVCNRGYQRIYIQSAFSMPDKEKEDQEAKSLLNVNDEFNKVIITGDDTPTHHNEQGIKIINVYDFMLNHDI